MKQSLIRTAAVRLPQSASACVGACSCVPQSAAQFWRSSRQRFSFSSLASIAEARQNINVSTIFRQPTRYHSSNSNNTPDASAPINAFSILGAPESFDIDLKDLKQKYRQLMTQFHPDKLGQQPQQQQQDDNATSAAVITHAYQQLTNPHKRAVHLLELRGNPLLEGSSPLVDMDFLQNVMAIREQVDAILLTHDNEGRDGDLQELQDLYQQNLQKMEATCEQLRQAFDTDQDLERALALTGELQYWNRIDETIRERLDTTELE